MRDLMIGSAVILVGLYAVFMAGYLTGRHEVKVKYHLIGGRHR